MKIPQVNLNPRENHQFLKIIRNEDLDKLKHLLQTTTVDNPVVECEAELWIDGQAVRKKIVCRTMWSNEKKPQYTGAIGKIIDAIET